MTGITQPRHLILDGTVLDMDLRAAVPRCRVSADHVYLGPDSDASTLGLWKFADDGWNDSSGNGLTLTPVGSPVLGEDGAYFDGTSCAYCTLDLRGHDALTVEAWVRPREIPSENAYALAQYYNVRLHINTEGKLAGSLSGVSSGGGAVYLVAPTAATVGEWHHLAMTFARNAVGGAKLWINGVVVVTANTGDYATGGTENTRLDIGALNNSYRLTGWVDNVRISNTVRWVDTFTPPARGDVYNPRVATLEGNSTYTSSGRHFDGVADAAVIPHDSGLLLGTAPWQLHLWAAISDTQAESYPYLIAKGAAAMPGKWGIYLYSDGGANDGKLRFLGDGGIADIKTPGTYKDNALHLFSVIRAGNAVRMYVDGVQVGEDATASINLNETDSLTIAGQGSYSACLIGTVVRVRLAKAAKTFAEAERDMAVLYALGPHGN